MARKSADEEILALGRCIRTLEALDDDHAQARVAAFLAHRFTSSIFDILPRSIPAPRGMTVDASEATAPTIPPPVAENVATATDGPVATPPATPPVAPAAKGWDLSGQGSEHDDDPPAPATQTKKVMKPAKPKVTKVIEVANGWDLDLDDGDPDEEVEIKL